MGKITLPAAIPQKQRKDELHEETRAQQHEFIDFLYPDQDQSGSKVNNCTVFSNLY